MLKKYKCFLTHKKSDVLRGTSLVKIFLKSLSTKFINLPNLNDDADKLQNKQ